MGKWAEFINGSGLGRMSLHQYYLNPVHLQLTDYDFEELSQNLFADAVAVGAIVIPQPYAADDFEFFCEQTNYGRGLNICLQGGRETQLFHLSYLRQNGKLTSTYLATLLAYIGLGAEELINAS